MSADRLDDFLRRGQAAQRAVDELQQMRLRRVDGFWRHFVGPVPLHVGQPIAALIDGHWIDGHYEATWLDGSPRASFHHSADDGGRRVTPLTEKTLIRVRAGARFGRG